MKTPPLVITLMLYYITKGGDSRDTFSFSLFYKIFDKNSFSLGSFGCSKNSFGFPSSLICPSSTNTTLVATSFANPISCVTTTIVIQLQNFSYHLRIQRRSRLIEQHHIRIHCQRPHDRNTLFLSTGKLIRICICLVCKSNPLQQFFCFFLCLFFRHLFQCHRCKHDIFQDRLMWKQMEMLEHHSDLLTMKTLL